ncbi:COG3650 family protein [Novosphingobium profundi]|uniref:COG3650 family protein n=1 Tax=Novosphingobium profundi TaxID=1774954 RepID=UPI001CFF4790|nr:hypothetical protein [Novosphingobium profundi]
MRRAYVEPVFVSGLAALILAGCQSNSESVPGDADDSRPWSTIAPDETVQASGTEPFWSVRVESGQMIYTAPDLPEGREIAVTRFAGRGGLSFSGERGGEVWTLAITQGACSDGMSDRSYPFTATLANGATTRQGCAWSAANPYRDAS